MPVTSSNARALILGTLPSTESLHRRQYYANPRNQFWRIMDELIGSLPEDYAGRLRKLTASGIALWDVCLYAQRLGSLDSRISMSTVVANEFAPFLSEHPNIRLICFNGRTAEKIFLRKVAAEMSAIRREVLPSSSPAHAIDYVRKVARWREVLSREIAVK